MQWQLSSIVQLLKLSPAPKLTAVLQKNSEATLKDTIIIKFDFDKENCWQGLDKDSFDYLLKVLDNHQKHRQELIEERPGVSFFEFRQPGSNCKGRSVLIPFKSGHDLNCVIDTTREALKYSISVTYCIPMLDPTPMN